MYKEIDISPCDMKKVHVTMVDVRGDEVLVRGRSIPLPRLAWQVGGALSAALILPGALHC